MKNSPPLGMGGESGPKNTENMKNQAKANVLAVLGHLYPISDRG